MYLLQNKYNNYIQTENPITYTEHIDSALLFKEEIINIKLKQYKQHKAIKYFSLGNIVNKY